MNENPRQKKPPNRYRSEDFIEIPELDIKEAIKSVFFKTVYALVEAISSRFDIENIGPIETIYSSITAEITKNNLDEPNFSIYTTDDEALILSQIESLIEFLKDKKKRFEFKDLKKNSGK
ncbi:unnamed protein product [Brachionus calyciflorus]|uniref:Uncharacterized protein n=1 Tax=Brachionus calyciflorus TaxID=104777 RepID=A0A813S9V1_9BILA|nr:unnamed protein product [Brachionus calyciflorus]